MTYAAQHVRYPMAGLGQVASAPAGEINGVQALLIDIQSLAQRANEFLPTGFRFNRSTFDRILAKYRPRSGETNDQAARRIAAAQQVMSADEVRQLIAGTVGAIGAVIVSAKLVAQQPVHSELDRAANHNVQSTMIDPARLMWSSLDETLNNMQQRRAQSTSGLGNPLVIVAIIGVAAIVYVVLGVSAIVALTYLVDSYTRAKRAESAADSICRAQGGCTPEQRAAIQQSLSVGPFDQAIRDAGSGLRDVITGLGVTGAIVGVLGVGGIAYYVWRKARGL